MGGSQLRSEGGQLMARTPYTHTPRSPRTGKLMTPERAERLAAALGLIVGRFVMEDPETGHVYLRWAALGSRAGELDAAQIAAGKPAYGFRTRGELILALEEWLERAMGATDGECNPLLEPTLRRK